MPVTAKLSRKFYERFGDELTNELVDWFNQVDTTYRGQLRDLNELNFARFDAKLEQRVTAVEAKIEIGLAHVEARFDAKLGSLEARFDARMAAFEARILKWMFLFWIGQAATTIGLVLGMVRLVGR